MPAPRVRVLQYLPALEARGCDCTVMAMRGPRGTSRALRSEMEPTPLRATHLFASWWAAQVFQARLVRRAGDYDRILMHRIPVSAWARPFLARHRDRLVYDFDDALYDAEPAGLVFLAAWRARFLRRSLERAVGVAGVVMTSNRANAEWARARGAATCIVPTSVDTDRIRPQPRAKRDRLVIGWMGTPSTSRYLLEVEDLLAEAIEGRAIVRLVGVPRSPFRRLQAEVRPWSLESESNDLAGFDIGIMPMPDTAWTRGKAAFKALQYGAASLPAVVSWTPTNEEILGPGGGAILCRSRQEWKEALGRLLADEKLRVEMGERGRAHVAAHYSVAVNASTLARVLLGPGTPCREARP